MSKVFGVKPGSSAQSDQVLRNGNKSPTPDSDMGNVLAVSDASIKSPQILPPAPTSILSPGKVVFSDEADKNIDGLPSNLEFNRSTDWSSNGDNNQINNEVEEEREGNTGEPNSGQQQEIEDQIDMLKFFEDMVPGEVGMEEDMVDMSVFAQADENGKFDLIMVALNKLNAKYQKRNKKIDLALMEEDMVDMSVFAQADENGKFDLIMVALNKLNAKYQKRNKKIDLALIEQDNGIFPRLQQNESTTDMHDTTIIDFQVKVTKLEDEVSQLKGIIQVQDRQISALKHEVTKLKTRSMKKNIVVTGIEGDDQGEDCKEKAKSFLNVQLKCKTESSEIKNAHRIGIESSGKPRPMVVKCGDKLRRDVFTYTKNLHKKKNTQGDRYFVDPQMPEELIAEKRALAAKVRRLKHINETCEPQQRAKIDIKNKKL